MAVSDYLSGSGTQSAPYVIHNLAAWRQFFNVDKNSGLWFEIVADIDCGGETFAGIDWYNSNLKANGHHVFNLKISSVAWFSHDSSKSPILDGLWLSATSLVTSGSFPFYVGHNSSYFTTAANCRFDISSSNPIMIGSGSNKLANCIINLTGTGNLFYQAATGYSNQYCIASTLSQINASGMTALVGSAAYTPSSYPLLDDHYWTKDAISIPYLIINGRPELTKAYAIKGVTKVGGVGRPRSVSVYYENLKYHIKTILSESNGNYVVNIGDIYDHVLVIHHEGCGGPFIKAKAYALGDIIHPSTPNGFRYVCTTAGTSSAAEPTSWPTTGTLTSGSAIFTAQPVYKPESFIVVPMLIDLVTGNPV